MPRGRLCVNIPEITEHFTVKKIIGQGSYGDVHLVRMKKSASTQFALKRLTRKSHPKRAEMEIRILRQLGGKNNIIRLFCSFRKDDRIFLFLEYFPHLPFVVFCETATMMEMRDYMKNLLMALNYIHEHGIIHRDIKPNNFLYDRRRKRYALIDFGLAEEMAPPDTVLPVDQPETSTRVLRGKRKLDFDKIDHASPKKHPGPSRDSPLIQSRSILSNGNIHSDAPSSQKSHQSATQVAALTDSVQRPPSRLMDNCDCFGRGQYCKLCICKPVPIVNHAGTSGFRAPETLLNASAQYQTTGIDVWACGMILLSLLSRRYPFMKPKYSGQALVYIMTLVGTQKIANVAKTIGQKVNFTRSYPRLDLRELCSLLRLNGKLPCVGGKEECLNCLSTFKTIPLSNNGVPLCLCYENVNSRGPVFKYCLDMEFTNECDTKLEIHDKLLFDMAFDLLSLLLEANPLFRIKAKNALNHDWFSEYTAE